MPDQPADLAQQFPEFVRAFAAAARSGDKPPATLEEWEQRKQQLRRKMIAAWGGFPEEKAPLEPKILGEFQRDGYRVQKIVFQTRPGIWMTANAYIPEGKGPFPAILHVHGHWKGAKQDPVVQSRCIGSVKHGFFVLSVDAFGAGERGLSKNLGEYHGEMVAATLFPIGLPLSGLQVYENMRAVDYLLTRPEVDGKKLGITGASGGGNQTMYAGAMDERFAAVVPVCSVGNYQVYLKAACCMCEVVPGALSFTEEAAVLSLVAPRGLMIVNATKDAIQFSVPEAEKSIAAARPVFELYKKPENLKHATFESPHDYNKAMREAMYGWMTLHLKGEGDGSPIDEIPFEVENPEELRCYPGTSRPDDFVTIPKFAAAIGREMLSHREAPDHLERWDGEKLGMRHALERDVLGGLPKKGDLKAQRLADAPTQPENARRYSFDPEPGITRPFLASTAKPDANLAIVIGMSVPNELWKAPLVTQLAQAGWNVAAMELRATGLASVPGDSIFRAPDHNSAEWSMWVGRPLLGQWTTDAVRLIDAIEALDETKGAAGKQITLIGLGPAGVVALCAAALDKRISQVVCVKTLATYVSDQPYTEQRLGIMAPQIVRKVGDIPHLAALVAPRPAVFARGVLGSGRVLKQKALEEQFTFATEVYRLLKAPNGLTLTDQPDPKKLAELVIG